MVLTTSPLPIKDSGRSAGQGREREKCSGYRKSAAELVILFKRLEQEIADRPYLALASFPFDAALIPSFLRMEKWAVGIRPNASLPRMGNWLQRIKERPSVKTFLASVSF
jgi:glutathione S-transferase